MTPLFSCDHGAATHSCIKTGRGSCGTLCKNARRSTDINWGPFIVTSYHSNRYDL